MQYFANEKNSSHSAKTSVQKNKTKITVFIK